MSKEKKTLEKLLEEALIPEDEQPYEVPWNWVWTYVSTINEIITGTTPPKKDVEFYGDYMSFVKPNDLEQGRFLFTSKESLSKKGVEVSRVIPKNSTLICCIGSIGKTGYTSIDCTTNQQINSLLPNKKIESLFTYYYSLTPKFQQILINNSSATTISIINKSKLSKIPFPLPPIQEQKRVVNRIESMFSKLDKAKALIEEAREDFEKRKASILTKAFKGVLTKKWREEHPNIESADELLKRIQSNKNISNENLYFLYNIPDKWKWIKINNYFNISGGGTPSKSNSIYWYGNILWISPKDMKMKKIITSQDKITEIALKEKSLKLANIGSVVIVARSGILEHTLPVAILGKEAVVNQDMKVYDSGNKLINEYFFWYILSQEKELLKKYSKSGTTVHSLKVKEFNEQPIPLPSEKEMIVIINLLKTLIDKEEEIKELIQLEEQIEFLKKVILNKAFKGQLGTNEPKEESAVELLKAVISKKMKINQ